MDWLPRFPRKSQSDVTRESWDEAFREAHHRARSCWIPKCVNDDGDRADSKFGGTPWLAKTELWPACGYCGAPLQFFLQVNAADLPADAADAFSGLIQFFYCTNDRCELGPDAYGAFGRNQLARIVPGQLCPSRADAPVSTFPAQRITGWMLREDLPSDHEAGDIWPEEMVDLLYEHAHEVGREIRPHRGDKLLGYPYWVQGVAYIKCPDCAKPMRYVLQVASEDHIPYTFGDSGVGHLSFCPDHPDRVGFYWSCC